MAYRLFANKLVAAGLCASLLVSGCIPIITPGASSVARADITPEEQELQKRSKALQKTVIEGAATGAAAGAALSLANGGNNFWRNVTIGAVVGGLAGSYVASLQRNFASREEQLTQAISDISKTNAETRATLQIMRTVQARDIAEINRFRTALAAGQTDAESLEARLTVARANLADMNGAIEGAENRSGEFTQARDAMAEDGDTSGMDSELSLLQNRIQQMRAVAAELSENV